MLSPQKILFISKQNGIKIAVFIHILFSKQNLNGNHVHMANIVSKNYILFQVEVKKAVTVD